MVKTLIFLTLIGPTIVKNALKLYKFASRVNKKATT